MSFNDVFLIKRVTVQILTVWFIIIINFLQLSDWTNLSIVVILLPFCPTVYIYFDISFIVTNVKSNVTNINNVAFVTTKFYSR